MARAFIHTFIEIYTILAKIIQGQQPVWLVIKPCIQNSTLCFYLSKTLCCFIYLTFHYREKSSWSDFVLFHWKYFDSKNIIYSPGKRLLQSTYPWECLYGINIWLFCGLSASALSGHSWETKHLGRNLDNSDRQPLRPGTWSIIGRCW